MGASLYFATQPNKTWLHVLCLFCACCAITIANCIVFFAPFKPTLDSDATETKQKAERGRKLNEYNKLMENTKYTLMYCDGPTTVALIVLFLFVFLNSKGDNTVVRNNEHLDAFIGGAVAFQLLLSNSVFGLHFITRLWYHRIIKNK